MNGNLFRSEFFSISGDVLDLKLIETNDGNKDVIPFYYWSICLKTGEEVGAISLRIGHNYHSYYNGNVGYEIHEPHQGHHYALSACRMIVEVARSHGMDHLILTCDSDNAASRKTIEALGGVLLEQTVPPKDYIFYHDRIAPHRIYRVDL